MPSWPGATRKVPACAQDAGRFAQYHDVLYTNQVEQGRHVSGRPAFSPDGKQIAFTLLRATGSVEATSSEAAR